jgi:photosystem II stability/assembly factor-like uncharacterized protein
MEKIHRCHALLGNEFVQHLIASVAVFFILVGVSPARAQNTWQLISPKLSGGSLDVVRATASGLVIVAGESGVILRSSDRGTSWQRIPSGTSRWLYGLSISSANKCITVGEAGTIFTSSDGGKSWAERQSGITSTLLAVEWLTNETAIAGGEFGIFLKTTDSGSTWKTVTSGITQQIESIQFISDSTGFAAGSKMFLKTTDAGTTWFGQTIISGYGAIRAMHFSDSRFGLLGDDWGYIWGTRDSGVSWTTRTPTYGYITSIYCVDSSTAIITNQNGIWRTTNQGNSLSHVYNTSVAWIQDVTFYTGTDGFAVGWEGTVLRTTDAGLTWAKTIDDIGANLTDVTFTSNSNGMVVASDSSIYSTADGGYAWTRRTAPTVFNQIYSLDSLNGFATGFKNYDFSSIWRTSDGGQNWEFLFNNSTWSTKFQGIGFWNALQGCVIGGYYGMAGHYGNVEHFTSDGGNTWSNGTLSLTTGAYPQLYSLSITDSCIGYAISSCQGYTNGLRQWYIIRTVDAGSTWTMQSTSTLPQGNAIHFVDRTTGFFVGDSGTIMRSDNGGITWNKQQSMTSANLTSVFFRSKLMGVAAGGSGTILTTFDGGVHWKTEAPLTTRTINKLFVTNDSAVIAIGKNGTIIHGQLHATNVEGMIPSVTSLDQNFPNPFNSSTIIRFKLSQPSYVTLRIFDLLGRQVATLIGDNLNPGIYDRSFSSTGFSSGVYFYQLQAGSMIETKKLVLLK